MIIYFEFGDQIAQVLGLDGLRIGRHILRNNNGMKTGERWIQCFWYCLVQIRCETKAIITVVEPCDSSKCDVVFALVNQHEVSHSVTAEISAQEVMPDFDSIKLGTRTGVLSLDGVTYSVGIESVALRAVIEFANPIDTQLLALEKAVLSIVRVLARATGQPVVSTFMKELELCILERSKHKG